MHPRQNPGYAYVCSRIYGKPAQFLYDIVAGEERRIEGRCRDDDDEVGHEGLTTTTTTTTTTMTTTTTNEQMSLWSCVPKRVPP